MKLVRDTKRHNSYTWDGLTLGKLLAIHDALKVCADSGKLTTVQYDVKCFLDNEGAKGNLEFMP